MKYLAMSVLVILLLLFAVVNKVAKADNLPTASPTYETYDWPTPTPLNYVWETWVPSSTYWPTVTPAPTRTLKPTELTPEPTYQAYVTWTPGWATETAQPTLLTYPEPATPAPYPGPGVNTFPIFSFRLWLPAVVR